MKLSNKTSFVFFMLFLIISVSACTKYVEIGPPTSQLVSASVFSNSSTATAALTSIYTSMNLNSESYIMSLNMGLLGDELTNYSNYLPQMQLYTNSMNSQGNFGCWQNAYNYIFQANAILAAIQGNNAIGLPIQQQLIGESKFIRAFWYFYLVNSYGDVPLVTSTDYSINGSIARSPKAAVYIRIIADLKDAQSLLNSNFIDGTDTTVTTDRSRPTKWAAAALLARVCLYTGDYSGADSLATTIINNESLFSLVPGLNNVFLANSSEAIWQLAIPLPTGQNTPDGYNYILLAAPGISGSGVSISSQLLSSFEMGDNRKTDWIGLYTDSTVAPFTPYYFPYKYKVGQVTDVTEYMMVLRLAEQYLIRAEARAQEHNITEALTDLNVIRNRAGLPNYSGATDPTSLLAAILHERQVELFTEWGHRWFDLVRTNNINSVMGSPGENVCQFKGGNWSPNLQLFPIPLNDIQSDHNLTQNPGYQ